MLSILCSAALGVAVALAPSTDGVVREGVGERRATLDQLELKPLSQGVWSSLSEWTNSDALSADNTRGKVVLFYTWSNWYPISVNRGMALAKRLHERHAGEGLLVVGVHHPEGWAEAGDVLASRGIEFPVALDAKGRFRELLQVDQDPDFYVIDRAGRMRFADIDASSVPTAVERLLEETPEQAENLLDRMAADEAERRRLAQRTRGLSGQLDLDNLPEVTLPEIPASAYAAVAWPALPEVNERSNFRRRGDSNAAPAKVSLPKDGYWPHRPALNGKAVVLYFWSPGSRDSYERIMPAMDDLQASNRRDVVVVGVATRLESSRSRGRAPASNEKDQDTIERFQEFTQTVQFRHTLLPDFARSVLDSVRSDGNISDGYAAVLSSDGTVRWRGRVDFNQIRSVLDKVVRIDPGVQARRAAEEAMIRSLEQSRPSGG